MLFFALLACPAEVPSNGPPALPANAVVLQVEYGSEKKAWMEAMVDRYEATSPKVADGSPIAVKTHASGSGEGMQAILAGTSQPAVYSPASSAYLTLLNQAWLTQPGHTTPIAPGGDPLVLSPIVIATWRPMAEALGWPAKQPSWKDLLEIAAANKGWGSKGHPEWGRFKLGHTHPGLSNSGLLAVLSEVYAGAGKTRGLTPLDLPGAEPFVAKVEQSLVHYGKSTSFMSEKMLERGPSYVSAAVLYENLVIESYDQPRSPAQQVVALYPAEGTFWSDHPYAVLDATWVTPAQKEAAKSFGDFLRARPQQEAALEHGFRPADPAVVIGAPIDEAHGVDPHQPETLLEVPDGATLSAVLDLWQRTKKTSDVVLVFDKSGSMQGEPLEQAKAGAHAFLDALGDRDTVSLEFFDSTVAEPTKSKVLGDGGRADLQGRVDGTLAEGGTALYDAVETAWKFEAKRAEAEPGRIHAVVVMTDGKDESSTQVDLDRLRAELAGQSEATVKVFTIAYGEHADPQVLTAIAEAGRGSEANGRPEDIAAVFLDMAAFF